MQDLKTGGQVELNKLNKNIFKNKTETDQNKKEQEEQEEGVEKSGEKTKAEEKKDEQTKQENKGDVQNELRKTEVYHNLPFEIRKANEDWREEELKYNVEVRPEDKVHQAFCHYMLLKMKCKYNIYLKIKDVLADTKEC